MAECALSYKNALPDPQYLAENKMPALLQAQISILDISDGFVIQQNGYFYDQNDVINIGYWSWQKLADELPYDYVPSEGIGIRWQIWAFRIK